ncbi:MAG TPA: hypothetical protein VLH59_04255 [Ignavibacteriaceae bacterium]|nr:hypothetical protein [Ignavibacteriaceae bacterium]
MENTSTYPLLISKIRTIVFDLMALLAIYLVPAVSHLLSLPVYFIEPMRIMLILALVHTSQKNAYLIALTLPVFSFLISAHPSLIKTSLITGELLLNVWLFFFLSEKLSNKTLSIFLSIIASKILYYMVKLLLINSALMTGNLISTPIYIQVIMLFVFSVYVYLFICRKKE